MSKKNKLFSLILLLAGSGFGCSSAQPLLSRRWDAESWKPGTPISHAIPLPAGSRQDLQVHFSNDDKYLYLFLASNTNRVKCQLLGAFHQSMLIWFGNGDQSARAVRISFHRMPGVGFPRSDAEEKEYWKASTRELALLRQGEEPKILVPNSKEVELETELGDGQLTYFLKLPLNSAEAGDWSLNARPGDSIHFGMETTAIEPDAAVQELIREYQEKMLGWGWGQQGYGPRRSLSHQKSYGIGDYDAWGLDQSIYATHGLYGHLSWESVPQRLDYEGTLKLAP